MLRYEVTGQAPPACELGALHATKGARRFYEHHGCEVAEFTDGSRNDEKLPDMRYVWRL